MQNDDWYFKERNEQCQIFHRHGTFWFKNYRAFLYLKDIDKDLLGPLCSYCHELTPKTILFQLKIINRFPPKETVCNRSKIYIFTRSKNYNFNSVGSFHITANKYIRKYITTSLGKKRQIELNKLLDNYETQYR